MRFRIETTGFPACTAALRLRAATIDGRVQSGLSESIDKLQTLTQAHSSGRPGPNIITGSFHDSWFTAVGTGEATLGNAQAQAFRLEFGFVGMDSLGRHYNQPPYSSLGPSVVEFGPEFQAIMAKAVW